MSSDGLPPQVTPLSEHTHLLVSLQRCFGRWVLSLRPDAYGAQYGAVIDEETLEPAGSCLLLSATECH